MSTNPFASPSEYASYTPPPPNSEDGYVKQILFVGVFMIVEGALELIYGIFMTGFAVIMPTVLANDPNFRKSMEEANSPMQSAQFVFWLYFALGAGPLIAGIFHIIGGIFALQKRARMFVLAANIIGFLSFTGCYCIPTGFATSIYSIIILLQTSVATAFALKAAEREKLKSY